MGPTLERVRYTVMKNLTSWIDVKLFERTFYDPKMNLMKEKRISFRRKTQIFFFSQAYFGTKTKDHSKWSWACKWWFYNVELVFYLHVNIGETIPYKKKQELVSSLRNNFYEIFGLFLKKKTKENLKKIGRNI